MSYTKQSNLFWKKDVEHRFSDKEIAFYFYLLKIGDKTANPNNLPLSNNRIIARFGWSKITIQNIKERLKACGLIDYTPGNGRGKSSIYHIIEATHSKKNKSVKMQSSNAHMLPLPFSSVRFTEIWQQLLQMPKWKTKSVEALKILLDKLCRFDEAFAIELIERCIIGGWQNIVFSDTHIHYQKWKLMQKQENEYQNNQSSQQRKAEISRRAADAAIRCN